MLEWREPLFSFFSFILGHNTVEDPLIRSLECLMVTTLIEFSRIFMLSEFTSTVTSFLYWSWQDVWPLILYNFCWELIWYILIVNLFSGPMKWLSFLHLYKFRGPNCFTTFNPIAFSSLIFNCSFCSVFSKLYENIWVAPDVTCTIFIGQSYFGKILYSLSFDCWIVTTNLAFVIRIDILQANFWEPQLKMSFCIKGILRPLFCIDIKAHSDRKWKNI